MINKSTFLKIIIVSLTVIFIVAASIGIFYWLNDKRTPQEQCEKAVLDNFYQGYAEKSDYMVEILGVETMQLDIKPVVDFYAGIGENLRDGWAFEAFRITIYYYDHENFFASKITYMVTILYSGHYADIDMLEVL